LSGFKVDSKDNKTLSLEQGLTPQITEIQVSTGTIDVAFSNFKQPSMGKWLKLLSWNGLAVSARDSPTMQDTKNTAPEYVCKGTFRLSN
jgi:hypothetical protein